MVCKGRKGSHADLISAVAIGRDSANQVIILRLDEVTDEYIRW